MSTNTSEFEAVVCLFAYNRPQHFEDTIRALSRNVGARETRLFVFIDGPKSDSDQLKISQIFEICFRFQHHFYSVKVEQRIQNIGLAENIVSGINSVFNHNEKVIVLEDDILTSPSFLKYMNLALNTYESYKEVGHINSFSCRDTLGDSVFLTDLMLCWGWGTWRERWSLFSHDIDMISEQMTNEKISKFSFNEKIPNWSQFLSNKTGKIKTWAVFWALSLFLNHKKCLQPPHSLCHNIGNDGSGVHGGVSSHYDVKPADTIPHFPLKVKLDIERELHLMKRLYPLCRAV